MDPPKARPSDRKNGSTKVRILKMDSPKGESPGQKELFNTRRNPENGIPPGGSSQTERASIYINIYIYIYNPYIHVSILYPYIHISIHAYIHTCICPYMHVSIHPL